MKKISIILCVLIVGLCINAKPQGFPPRNTVSNTLQKIITSKYTKTILQIVGIVTGTSLTILGIQYWLQRPPVVDTEHLKSINTIVNSIEALVQYKQLAPEQDKDYQNFKQEVISTVDHEINYLFNTEKDNVAWGLKDSDGGIFVRWKSVKDQQKEALYHFYYMVKAYKQAHEKSNDIVRLYVNNDLKEVGIIITGCC